jgi:outer membrane protein OmpA-like peptidoglycan-associated protein
MSPTRTFLLSLLILPSATIPLRSQTPSDTTVSDTAQKKTGRFGGLMNKAKQVAGNKAVQNAAKGAATNVACTAVPGAAVAAANGKGPCQNTVMAGLMAKTGIAGAAANLANGKSSALAASAMGKMNGTASAAAVGALGASGNGTVSKMAAAANAGGMGQAAALAAAAQVMPGAVPAPTTSGVASAIGGLKSRFGKSKPAPANAAPTAAATHAPLFAGITSSGRVATQGLMFNTFSAVLTPESAPALGEIASMLVAHPELRLRIEDHTFDAGSKDANLALSTQRAAAVKAALISAFQIPAGRLDSKGMGDTKPIRTDISAEAMQANQRVELVKM